MNKIVTNNLKKIYNNVYVVNGVCIEANSFEIVGLLGRNGAGKTTTFLMISGIIKPDYGNVSFNNEEINDLTSNERANKGLIYLPQQNSVFLKAKVYDNLFQILELKVKKKQAKLRTEELLEEFGLSYVAKSYAYMLSGGEKRRLEIARAMIMNPKFLFLDEPFTGIDPITILEIQKILLKLKHKGIGIIITDHNVKDTFDITDRAYIMNEGKILSSGSPDILVNEEVCRHLFLGDSFQWTKVARE